MTLHLQVEEATETTQAMIEPSQEAPAIVWRWSWRHLVLPGLISAGMAVAFICLIAVSASQLLRTPLWAAGAMLFLWLFLVQFIAIHVWVWRLWNRPAFIADENGLVDLTPWFGGPVRIAWHEVARAVLLKRKNYEFLLVIPHEPETMLARRPFIPRMRQRWIWRLLRERPVITFLSHLDAPIEEIAAAIAAMAGIAIEDRR